MFCGPSTDDGEHRQSRVHKTYCFPRSQSISVNYLLVGIFSKWPPMRVVLTYYLLPKLANGEKLYQ